ncbi:hypothetical protein MA13_contig00011-0142 [Edwardsiella piscicida]|nr:restriction endonuclease subunit S [Edwardsiella anguillarum]GAJ68587.1 hypothetical protein MA13_contig00011-0142 [Edwardsiella piscicida]
MVHEQQSDTAGKSVPAGYKLTEVGVIPEDWGVKTINEIAKVYSGGTPNRKIAQYWDGDIPWVTTTLIDGNDISHVDEYITDNGLNNSSTKWCDKDTLLMAMYGQGKTRGKVGILRIRATINQACAAISLYEKASVKYLFHYLNSKYAEIRELSNSGGQENLSGTIIKILPIPYPSDRERLIIADTLSDIDTFILTQERLLVKKQAIKTAAMQQLLTGKIRLPQFALRKDGSVKGYKKSELGKIPEDWVVSTFVSVIKIRHGKNQKHVECLDGEYPIYATGGQIGKANAFLYNKPSVLIGRKGTIDKPRYTDKPFWTVDTLFYSEISESADAQFIYYKFCMIDWMQYNEASGVPSLNASTIESIQTVLPSIEEQIAIATILSDMDKEIQTLQQRLDKTRQLKQGMMQELLTGKTRLI